MVSQRRLAISQTEAAYAESLGGAGIRGARFVPQ